MGQLQIKVNEKVYLKDPNSSDLGKRILEQAMIQIDQSGFEQFTFGKLAKALNTVESSVYRYFENKHKLLIYLISWYWSWLEYQFVFSTANLTNPEAKLKAGIRLVSTDFTEKGPFGHIHLDVMSRIVVSESSKAYLTKEVDNANKVGLYADYKRYVARLSDVVLELNPNFPYSRTLVSTIIEGAHHQKYFAAHLPSLTDSSSQADELTTFYTKLALATIKSKSWQ